MRNPRGFAFPIVTRAIFSLMIISLAIAARPAMGQDADQRLIGSWRASLQVDVDKLRALADDQDIGDEQIKTLVESLANAKLLVEFRADHTTVMTTEGFPGSQRTIEGRWRIESVDGDELTVIGNEVGGAEEETIVTFDGEDKFTLSSENLKASPFRLPVFERVEDE